MLRVKNQHSDAFYMGDADAVIDWDGRRYRAAGALYLKKATGDLV